MAKLKQKSMIEILQNQSEQIQIPIYQRNYDWTFDNVKKLIDDLIDFRKQLEDDEDSVYFLGNMVYKKNGSMDDTLTKLTLVDGQQRITTTLIILAALKNLGINTDNYLKVDENGEPKLKISKLKNSAALKKIFNNSDERCFSDEEKETNYYKNYFKTLEYIQKKNINPTSIKNLLENTIIAWVQLTKKENENVVFETINSTGRPLKSSDLIKNYIFFGALNFTDAEEKFLIDLYSEKIEKLFSSSKEVDEFYRYFVAVKGGYELPKKESRDIYSYFMQYIEDKKINLYDFESIKNSLLLILKSAIIFKEADLGHNGNNSSVIESRNNFFRMIFKENKNTYFGIYYSMRDYYCNLVGDKIVERSEKPNYNDVLKAIARFIIFRSVAAKKDKNITRDSVKFFHEFIKMGKSDSISEFIKFMENRESIEQRIPSTNDLLENIKNIDAYKVNVKKTKNILLASEIGAPTTTPFSQFDVKWQVEHIMPQSWHEFWQPDLGPEVVGKFVPNINKLTNLTLLTNKLNPQISNREFSYKKKMILDDSRLSIDKILMEFENYSEDLIEARAKMIKDNILRLFQ